MKLGKIFSGASLGFAAVLSVATTAFAVTTITVLGNTAAAVNEPGWMFNRDPNNATPIEFNQDAASIGVGSLYVEPIPADAPRKFIGENFLNTPISEISSISYDYKIGSGGDITDEEQFYMNVYANFGSSDDLKFYDCRYSIVPSTGSKTNFTTVVFDPNQSYPVQTRTGGEASPFACPSVPAQMDTLSPNSNVRAFSLNLGDTTLVDVGIDGYFDNVVVSKLAETVVYDFEPTLMPTTKNDCKKDGWMTFNNPTFKNQGECVSSVTANPKSGK